MSEESSSSWDWVDPTKKLVDVVGHLVDYYLKIDQRNDEKRQEEYKAVSRAEEWLQQVATLVERAAEEASRSAGDCQEVCSELLGYKTRMEAAFNGTPFSDTVIAEYRQQLDRTVESLEGFSRLTADDSKQKEAGKLRSIAAYFRGAARKPDRA
jgi:hypothetical protein